MVDPDTGCTEQEMNDTDWQAIMLEEQEWREREDQLEQLKEMEKSRGE